MAQVRAPDVTRPDGGDAAPGRPAGFRYAAVLGLTLVVVMWLVVCPDTDWSRAGALALECASLIIVIATCRTRPDVRRLRVAAVALAAVALLVALAAGLVPAWLASLAAGTVTAAIPLALI